MQTKGAIGNLINRYRAVLKKCNLLNTFGTLAIASALAMGGAGLAGAVEFTGDITLSGEKSGESYSQYGSYQIGSAEAVEAGSDMPVGVRVESELNEGTPTGNYGIYLQGDHTLNGAKFTIETDDHAGYGARVGFEGASGNPDQEATITVIGDNYVSQQLTIHGKTKLAQAEGEEKGKITVTGYLTTSADASGSDLSGADLVAKKGIVGTSGNTQAGGMILGYDVTVGNLTFENSRLALYVDSSNTQNNKTLTINDGTVKFIGQENKIDGSTNGTGDSSNTAITFKKAGEAQSAAVEVTDGSKLSIERNTTLDGVTFTNNGTVDLTADLSVESGSVFQNGAVTIGKAEQEAALEVDINVASGGQFNVDSLIVAGAEGSDSTVNFSNAHDTTAEENTANIEDMGVNVYVGELTVGANSVVNVSGAVTNGAMNVSLAAGSFDLSKGGQLNVLSGGTFEVHGDANGNYTLNQDIISAEIADGKVNVASGGRFKAEYVTFTGESIETAGTLQFNTLTSSNDITLSNDGTLYIESELNANTTLDDFSLNLRGDNGGTVNGKINVGSESSGGELYVTKGDWTVNDTVTIAHADSVLNVSGGNLTVAGLDVSEAGEAKVTIEENKALVVNNGADLGSGAAFTGDGTLAVKGNAVIDSGFANVALLAENLTVNGTTVNENGYDTLKLNNTNKITVTDNLAVGEDVEAILIGTGGLQLGYESADEANDYLAGFAGSAADWKGNSNKGHTGDFIKALVTNDSSGALTLQSGYWKIDSVTVQGGAFNVNGSDSYVTDVDVTGIGAVAVNTGILRVGNINLSGSGMTIQGEDGADTIGEVFVNESMTVASGQQVTVSGNGVLHFAENAAITSENTSGAISFDGGIVNAYKAQFTKSDDSDAFKDNLIVSGGNGYLNLAAATDEEYSIDDIKNLNSSAGDVLVSITGGNLTNNEVTATDVASGDFSTPDLDLVESGGAAVSIGSSEKQQIGLNNVQASESALTVASGSSLSVIGNVDTASLALSENSSLNLGDFTGENVGSGTVSAQITGSGSVVTAGNYVLAEGASGDLAITVNGGSLTAGAQGEKDLEVTSVAAAGAAFTANKVSVTDNASFTNGSVVNVNVLEGANNKNISVGSSEDTVGGTSLSVNNMVLKGGNLIIDPAFEKDGQLVASTEVSIVNFGTDTSAEDDITVDGNIGVGMNSLLTVGSEDKSLIKKALADLGAERLTADGYSAAMYLHKGISVESGKGIIIDGTKTNANFTSDLGTNGHKLTIADKGLLVVNAESLQDAEGKASGAAISFANSGSVDIASGATVYLANIKEGSLTLVDGLNKASGGSVAEGAAFKADNRLLTVSGDVDSSANLTDGSLDLTIDRKKAEEAFDGINSTVGSIFDNYELGSNQFLENVLSQQNSGTADTAKVQAAVEGAARSSVVAGAPQQAISVATQAANYASARTSFAPRVAGAAAMDENGQYTNISAGDNMANGANLWIMPMYQHQDADGFQAGTYQTGYTSDFAGLVLGGDYTWDNSFRLGVSFNMGAGSSESQGDLAYSENDYDSLGVALYAGYMLGNLGLSFDVNYTNVSNEITQNNAGGTLVGENDTNVFGFGARAEYKIQAAGMDFVPYIGARFSHISMDRIDMNMAGATVLTGMSADANIWQFPIGVNMAKDFSTESGWTFTPSVDLSIIPVAGDKDLAQDVAFVGVNGITSMESEIMDSVSGRVQVGLEASKGNYYMGLDYAYQGSSNMDSHGVQATFGLKF